MTRETDAQRMARNERNLLTTGHDLSSPVSYLNAVEAAWLAADAQVPRCAHCTEERHLTPMGGAAWAVEVTHELHCPQHDDNQPSPRRDRRQ